MDILAPILALPGVGPYVPYITALVAVSAALAPALPPPSVTSYSAYIALYKVVNLLAINVGHASNAKATDKPAA